MTRMTIPGLHHVTAIASDPQQNLDFYARMLGLRLVKWTVNFDDPSTYHLYYGNETGDPGTILTFFTWPGARRGRAGIGQALSVAFSIPRDSLGYWLERFMQKHIAYEKPAQRFGDTVITFHDPDGLLLELIACDDARLGQGEGEIPTQHAIRGLHSVTLCEDGYEKTAQLLTQTLGFQSTGNEGNYYGFSCDANRPGSILGIRCVPDFWKGTIAAGTIHHVALRTPTDDEQKIWHEKIAALQYNISPILDRRYFRSIYFHEPGGVLLEIATDPPGFSVDESVETLGTELKLPIWLEPARDEIVKALPPLSLRPAKHEHGKALSIEPSFIHHFVPGQPGKPPLLLLHGTGGSETDLIALAQEIAPGSAFLSPRGKVLEEGMSRFFRRLSPGVFDEKDIRERAAELAAFVRSAAQAHDLPHKFVAVGYSNGATMAAALLLLESRLLRGAILLRPALPLAPDPLPDLSGLPVFVAGGESDTVIDPSQTKKLIALLREAGADVTEHWEQSGHGLKQADNDAAAAWLRKRFPRA